MTEYLQDVHRIALKKIDPGAFESFRRLLDKELLRRGHTPPVDNISQKTIDVRMILRELDDMERQLRHLQQAGVEPNWDLVSGVIEEIRMRILEISLK